VVAQRPILRTVVVVLHRHQIDNRVVQQPEQQQLVCLEEYATQRMDYMMYQIHQEAIDGTIDFFGTDVDMYGHCGTSIFCREHEGGCDAKLSPTATCCKKDLDELETMDVHP
jgi:hypothetical protein